jgi:hypothetical protein
MKRILVVAGLALALGLGYASAQNITKSLQGSQDPRGPAGWDTSNAIYFPGHINAYGQTPATTLSLCGTGVLNTGSTDAAGSVWAGASGTSCVVVFGAPFNNLPNCVVTQAATPTSGLSYGLTTATTNFTVKGLASATSFFYICIGNS